MEKLQWMFELIDKMSAPMAKIDKALEKVDKTMHRAAASSGGASTFSKIIAGVGNTFGPTAASWLLKFAGGVAKVGDKLDAAKPALSAFGKGALAVGGIMATVAIAIASAVASMAVAGAGWAIHFLSFREDSIAAFKAMTGSQAAADRIFDRAVDFAAKTPFKESQVVTIVQTLMTRGFKENELDTLLKGVGDVGAMLGLDKMNSVIDALGKMRSAGHATGDAMEQLAQAGINSKLIYASLAKQLNVTEAAAHALLSAGKITDVQGITATMDAIKDGLSGGKLGGAMEAKSASLSGLLSTLAGVPENLMSHAGKGLTTTLMAPLEGLVKDVIGLFRDDKGLTVMGERVVGLFVSIGTTIGSIISMMRGDSLTTFFAGAMNVLEPLIKATMGFAKGFFSGFIPVVTSLFQMFAKMSNDPAKTAEMVDGLTKLGEVAGFVFGHIVNAGIVLVAAFVWVVEAIGFATEAVDGLFNSIASIDTDNMGKDLCTGLINGMLSMLDPAAGATAMLADTILATLEDRLGIASPSTKGIAIGMNLGNSVPMGMEMSDMAKGMQPSQFVANQIVSSGNGDSGNSGCQVNIDHVENHFNIDGANKDGNQIAKEASQSFTLELASALSGHALELGR